MQKQTAILLSPFFYPEPISSGKYNTFLAKGLAESGWQVHAITSHPLYPDWRPEKSRAQLKGVQTHRGGAWVRYPAAPLLRRAVLELWYTVHANRLMRQLHNTAEVLVPIFPPTLFFPAVASRANPATRTVGIVHDLQGVMAVHSGRLSRRMAGGVIRAIEAKAFRSCDRLIFLSHSTREKAEDAYGLGDVERVVCYPFHTLKEGEKTKNLAETLPKDRCNVVYSGALGEKQNPDELLALFEQLVRRHDRVDCHVFSRGYHFETMRQAVSADLSARIKFHDLVPEPWLPELFARSDLQLIPQAKGTADGAFPSKLPNLVAAGVPVVVISQGPSEVGLMLRTSGAGMAVQSWDVAQAVEKIGEFIQGLASESRDQRIERLQPFVDEHFGIDSLVQAITEA